MKKIIFPAMLLSFMWSGVAQADVWPVPVATSGLMERMNAIPEPAPKRFARAEYKDPKNEATSKSGDPKNEMAPITKDVAVPVWRASAGRSLHTVLSEWTKKAGWTLAWNTDQDYILRAGVGFEGNFVDSSSLLIKAFADAYPPVYGQFHSGNHVLVITTPKDIDQR